MKLSRLEQGFVVALLILFGGIVLHAPFSVFFGVSFPEYELLIKSWKEIILVLLIPVVSFIITKRLAWRKLLNDLLFQLIILYALLHILIAAVTFESFATVAAGLAGDLRYILFFCYVYIALQLFPGYRQLFFKVGVIGAFVVVGFATVQLLLPPDFLTILGYSKDTISPYLTVDKNPDFIRVNSTLRGPNPLGAYAGMVLSFIAAATARRFSNDKKVRTYTGVLAVCAAVALWISYSRSALVAAILAVAGVFAVGLGGKITKKTAITMSVVLLTVFAGIFIAKDTTFVSNVILHENPTGGSSVSSNDDHVSSLQIGLERVMRQPFGAGIGTTGSASLYGDEPLIIENQYLFIAHESGWLGFIVFAAIFIIIMKRLWAKRANWFALGAFMSGISLTFIGLLLPVWADDTVGIIWWGVAAIALQWSNNGTKKTKQKTTRTT